MKKKSEKAENKELLQVKQGTTGEPNKPTIIEGFPHQGLVRLVQIIGDKKKGKPGFIPISKSGWWAGVKSGIYPQPVKLSDRCTCWYAEDVRALTGRD